jgi:hypothetical protein
MEVYHCLNDIITTIEKEAGFIGKAIFAYGSIAFIDFNKLKYNPRLEGANVFKMLFNIAEDSPYNKIPMQIENGCITLMRELGISNKQWILFNIFLNDGEIPGYIKYMKYKNTKYENGYFNGLTFNLDQLKEVCAKFGGIPCFDLFYEGIMESSIMKNDQMTPELDFDSIYQWKRIAQGEHIASRDGWTFRRSIQEETCVYHDYSRSWRYMRAPSSESKHDDIDSD